MANQNEETLGELYARIGLNFDELENGIIEVERTLRQNIQRLNRERNIINLQTRIDLTGLDAATDATRIFEIRQRSLQQQLQNQRQRLNLLNNALQDTVRRTGANSDETQRATIEYENARLAVARLENQLEELNENQNRGTNWADRIVEFSQKLAPVILVSRAVFDAFSTISEATDKLIEKLKELNKTAYNFNLPIDKADEFARKIRLAGGELEDIGGYLRGITDALIKGEIDDPEYIALKRYNETIFDATGKLKNYAEIWEAVHRAFKKAKAEGNEVNFLQMTGGESGVTDAMQALQNWERAVKDAEKIIKAKIDYSQLDEATRQTNLLNEQFDEFGKQVAEIFSPAKKAMVENFFAVIRAGTEFLVENRDALKSAFELPAFPIFSPVEYKKAEEAYIQRLNARIKKQANEFSALFDTSAGLEKAHEQLKKRLKEQADKDSEVLMQYSKQRAKDLKDATEDLKIEIDFDSDYQKAVATAQLERKRALDQIVIGKEERKAIEVKYNADIEKAEKDLQDCLDDLWKETAAIQYETSHSAFEKEIYDIENWKKKAIEDLGEYKDAVGDKGKFLQEQAAIAANAAAKETQAFQNEIDRIRGNVQSLSEKIFEQTHSQRDIDIMRAQKQHAEFLNQGNPASLVNEWYNNEIGKIAATKGRGYKKAPKLSFGANVPDFYGEIQRKIEAYTPQLESKLKNQISAAGNLDTLANNSLSAAQALAKIPTAVQGLDFSKVQLQVPTLQIEPIVQQIQFDFDIFKTATDNASIALTELAVSTQDATANIAKIFSSVNDNLPQTKLELPNIPSPTIQPISVDSPKFQLPNLDLSLDFSKLEESANKAAGSLDKVAQIDLQKLQSIPEIPKIEVDIQHLNKITQQMTQQLADLSQTAGSIAQSVNQNKQPPQITVAPVNNINVNLGGAYVFDNTMKAKLTDDITSNVANAVTDAVNKATSNIGYGYGN